MLFTEAIAAYSANSTTFVNTPCRQNAELLYAKAFTVTSLLLTGNVSFLYVPGGSSESLNSVRSSGNRRVCVSKLNSAPA
jgi:hypothetical protein